MKRELQNGLYLPQFEHDACGIGAVVSLDGVKSLLVIDETDESAGSANIHPANWLIQATGKA